MISKQEEEEKEERKKKKKETKRTRAEGRGFAFGQKCQNLSVISKHCKTDLLHYYCYQYYIYYYHHYYYYHYYYGNMRRTSI